MSEATQEAIVKFVESEAPHLESFTVTWYGGEPLLALDIIESLSLKFIDICKKNDIAYPPQRDFFQRYRYTRH